MPQNPNLRSFNHLNTRDRKFIRKYIETGDPLIAIQSCGSRARPEYYSQVAYSYLRRLRAPIQEMMIECGLDNLSLIRVLKEGLQATVTYSSVRDGVLYERTYPNYYVRHRYLDTALKLAGTYAPVRIDQRNINVDMSYAEFVAEAHRQREALYSGEEVPEEEAPDR